MNSLAWTTIAKKVPLDIGEFSGQFVGRIGFTITGTQNAVLMITTTGVSTNIQN